MVLQGKFTVRSAKNFPPLSPVPHTYLPRYRQRILTVTLPLSVKHFLPSAPPFSLLTSLPLPLPTLSTRLMLSPGLEYSNVKEPLPQRTFPSKFIKILLYNSPLPSVLLSMLPSHKVQFLVTGKFHMSRHSQNNRPSVIHWSQASRSHSHPQPYLWRFCISSVLLQNHEHIDVQQFGNIKVTSTSI